DQMMYVVFKDDDFLDIDAICSSEKALGNYLEDEMRQFNESLDSKPPTAEINRVKTLYDKEYEITASVPTNSYQIICSELVGFENISKSDIKKVWVAHCLTPFVEVTIYSTEDAAKAKVNSLRDADDPDSILNSVEELEVFH
ncbi:MAG: hypothetical protein J7L43_03015, partial [Candidatus Aenigmarchaeota archaeon]|nr:hypothetical protein [Candidatus Aenigmarchaeota archaeon]